MEEVLSQLVERVRNRHYGKYRGFVVSNEDPQNLGRLQLRVPAVLGEEATNWALPCMPFGGLTEQGLLLIPDVDACVWVEFEAGDPARPLWTGTFWPSGATAPVGEGSQSTARALVTARGHRLLLDDTEGEEIIRLEHAGGASLEMSAEGNIVIKDEAGASITLNADGGTLVIEDSSGNTITLDSTGTAVEDANGNRIEMSAGGITVSGQQVRIEGTQVVLGGSGGEPVIKGRSFLTLFATHVHTCTGPGSPSSPPIPQGEMSTLSTTVTST